ncbi:Os12g0108933 [Oryza sativa Japonica Group]|uniref:Os12g0108933 protein n=1 Tax=Oryza sativa subsp. japonica TaxID=39947 RepID=A0A0N7KTG2_ORYSJ|nr:hypothetical protein EE612_057359 [Oryza sativa]BAT15530.1 Os12g0108933 [Oryza sativa Japonica Group]
MPVWVWSHQLLSNAMFTSDISTETTVFIRIPSLWRAISAPPIPENKDKTFMPLGKMSLSTERWYATVSTWNEFPRALYLASC